MKPTLGHRPRNVYPDNPTSSGRVNAMGLDTAFALLFAASGPTATSSGQHVKQMQQHSLTLPGKLSLKLHYSTYIYPY